MIIFSIDTSQAASVALVDTDTGRVLAAEHADDQRKHVEFIGPAMARILSGNAAPDLVVIGTGPGPFTGLRVGIAAGIAVGQARGIPVKGLASQAAQAEEYRYGLGSRLPEAPVLVAGDARRKELYFSVYTAAGGTGAGLGLLAGPFVAKPAEVADVLADHGFAMDSQNSDSENLEHGNAVDSTIVSIGARIGRGFVLYEDILGLPQPASILDPRAEFLAFAAAGELAAGGEMSEPVPEYLREPDALATPVRTSTLK